MARNCKISYPEVDVSGIGTTVLQDFLSAIQGTPQPHGHRLIRWKCSRRADHTEFRCTVTFVLDGVPHSVVGTWQKSIRWAQCDAVDRALGSLQDDLAASVPQWSLKWQGSQCRAVVSVQLFGALHSIQGGPAMSEASAKEDVLRLFQKLEEFEPRVRTSPMSSPKPAAVPTKKREELKRSQSDPLHCTFTEGCTHSRLWRLLRLLLCHSDEEVLGKSSRLLQS
eukprot:CAMPEP_0194522446 /NCGR_PEP_ID=MMETSP0253-20130528/57017_1 /TAXON_ID=2966 /ORGANISM="Noctiluca scintillans" /LENGTH=223 /DNA_ID=CAMNT_0039366885 /DNA_START=24 /DNA_END=695 /DNA_ORIENTATION=+